MVFFLQFFLGDLLIGDIPGGADQLDQLFLIDNGLDDRLQPDIVTRLMQDAVADDNAFFRRLVGQEGQAIGTHKFMPVIRVDIMFDRPADDIIDFIPKDGADRRREVPDGAVDRMDADDILGVLGEQPELLFAVEQGVFRFFLERNVLRDPEFHLIRHHFSLYGQIAHPALLGDDPAGEGGLVAGILLLLDGFGKFLRHEIEVFRNDIQV